MCQCCTYRVIYAFARTRGVPFSQFFIRVNHSTRLPVRAAWLAVLCAFAMSAFMLVPPNGEAFGAVTGYAYACLQISYGIPIFCRLTVSRGSFRPGPFHLGQYSGVVGWTAIAWLIASIVSAHIELLHCAMSCHCIVTTALLVEPDLSVLQSESHALLLIS